MYVKGKSARTAGGEWTDASSLMFICPGEMKVSTRNEGPVLFLHVSFSFLLPFSCSLISF